MVTLTVQRSGEKKPVDIILTRSVIRVKTVKYELKATSVISASLRSPKTDSSLKAAVATLKTQIGGG
jgi:C-terminal processing protease CtpA/Prc